MTLGQSFKVVDSEFVLYSFETSLALIGGYSTLIWALISLSISWYQEFDYRNSIASSLYKESVSEHNFEMGKGFANGKVWTGQEHIYREAEKVVRSRKPYDPAGNGLCKDRLLMPIAKCCCCRKR